jgi:hypothetical protein
MMQAARVLISQTAQQLSNTTGYGTSVEWLCWKHGLEGLLRLGPVMGETYGRRLCGHHRASGRW